METHRPHDRILVAYDSRLGSTAEVAACLGRALAEQAASVDVLQIAHVADIGRYDRVIVGSAIRYDRWLPAATSFVEANREALSGLPVAMFFTCLALAKGSAQGERKAAGYAEVLRVLLPEASDVQVGGFAGVLDPSRGPLWTRMLLRVLAWGSGIAPGDYRDWVAIQTWAQRLAAPPAGSLEASMRPGSP